MELLCCALHKSIAYVIVFDAMIIQAQRSKTVPNRRREERSDVVNRVTLAQCA